MSNGACARPLATDSPPKPPPTIRTRGLVRALRSLIVGSMLAHYRVGSKSTTTSAKISTLKNSASSKFGAVVVPQLTAACPPLSLDERLPIFVVALKYRPPMVPIAGCYAGACVRSSAKAFQCRDYDLWLHALTEFDIDFPRFHESVASNDKFRCHRQEVRLISMIFFKLDPDLLV